MFSDRVFINYIFNIIFWIALLFCSVDILSTCLINAPDSRNNFVHICNYFFFQITERTTGSWSAIRCPAWQYWLLIYTLCSTGAPGTWSIESRTPLRTFWSYTTSCRSPSASFYFTRQVNYTYLSNTVFYSPFRN